MSRDLDLADKMRRAGLAVVEVAGWQARGSSSFEPRGFLWHHTAGPARGVAPSLGVCVNGRSGLPGPLCNVFLDRAGTVYVVAAGRANHAGAGSWAGLTGNASVYGLEIENVGTAAEPWSERILDIAARIAVATGVETSRCCLHREWAPRRKVDLHTVTGDSMRARVDRIRSTLNPQPRPEVETRPPEVSMFLILEGVGLFAVVDGIPVGFPTLQEYAAARDASTGVPVMTLKGAQARTMFEWLLRRLDAATS